MCGFEYCISTQSGHYYLLTWNAIHINQLKERSHNVQNRWSGEISIRIFETYSNALRPHLFHVHNTAADLSMAKMCPCPYKNYGMSHWQCVLRCCDKWPIIFIPSQEANKYITNTFPTIRFHVYQHLSRCESHVRHPYK